MKRLATTILLLTLMFVSTLAYSQNGRTSTTTTTSESTIQPKSYTFPSGSFIVGTNFGYGYTNENYNPSDNSSSFGTSSQAYNLNLNVGYMLTTYTQIGLNYDRNFYQYNNSNTKNSNNCYGLFVSQYLLTDRFTPFVSLSSSLINGKRIDGSLQETTPYKGYNAVLSLGLIYYLVNDFYIQGNFNLVTYQNLDYTVKDSFSNTSSTVNNQQFLLGLNQPISLGVFYNFHK